MENLRTAETLSVRQKKEWGEILTGFESRNRYAVSDSSGREVYLAAEESSLLARLFLKVMRPFSMHILSPEGRAVLRAEKPFRFYFHEISVLTAEGAALGRVVREFSLLEKKFRVFDAQGMELYSIRAPLLHPWTFTISRSGLEAGKITKNWSGLGKEVFTDADNFSVEFPSEDPVERKGLLLGALFLIDLVYFEK
ncbi:MAG: phospholipid scramblase-related protein [Elusimicrobiales bacterium]|nr:phospholipid scramblase-related protein [Elusimicrobiales bacterium]